MTHLAEKKQKCVKDSQTPATASLRLLIIVSAKEQAAAEEAESPEAVVPEDDGVKGPEIIILPREETTRDEKETGSEEPKEEPQTGTSNPDKPEE